MRNFFSFAENKFFFANITTQNKPTHPFKKNIIFLSKMCYFINLLYANSSRLYNYFKLLFAHVEELGVELEVIEDHEILAPISVELFLNRC